MTTSDSYTVKNNCVLSISLHALSDLIGSIYVLLNGNRVLCLIDDASIGGLRNTLSATIPVLKDSTITFSGSSSAAVLIYELEIG